ncbi:hypothetical protein PIROE2DRAFT_63790 [Piromyces sp. E2]|nr:hypothetical protein PIROE2DRAFT_63790 [Piromyces sp. E2]|eukprot:OUM59422.1 hypothetical protein PIROE2DRAFT_63790 [Piromyces sp. E2]
MILLDKILNFEKWERNWKDWTTSNLSYENLLMGYSKYKIKSYPELEKLVSSFVPKNLELPIQKPPLLFYQLLYQKLSILLTIMEVFLCFSNHSQIKNYIAHHLYDNGNTSYTTFIHQPSCNAMLCQHQSYLDRECMCKFLLGLNRWFFSMAKMDKSLTQNIIIDNLLNELTKDINISDLFSYTNLPEIIVNIYSHNDSEMMDTLILLQNNFICCQYKGSKSLNNRCPVIATILEFSSPIKLFEALMHNISYDKEILLDWIISNETSFLEYLLRYLDYTELYCSTASEKENIQEIQENMEVNNDDCYKEKINYHRSHPYHDNNSRMNNKRRMMVVKEDQENDIEEDNNSPEWSIQHLSNKLKYTSIVTERPSKETVELLSHLRNTIEKLSKHDLIPFSPKPLLRKMDLYHQKFSFLL